MKEPQQQQQQPKRTSWATTGIIIIAKVLSGAQKEQPSGRTLIINYSSDSDKSAECLIMCMCSSSGHGSLSLGEQWERTRKTGSEALSVWDRFRIISHRCLFGYLCSTGNRKSCGKRIRNERRVDCPHSHSYLTQFTCHALLFPLRKYAVEGVSTHFSTKN